MPYTHFRYIAYEVPTVTSQIMGPNRSGFLPGNLCDPVPRIPVSRDAPTDAEIRLRRLAAVVDRAVTHVQTRYQDGADTLKIFMAPEFYFRPPKRLQNFPNDTYPYFHAIAIFEQLDKMFVDPGFEHWLIVAGTVMWNFQEKEDNLPKYYRNSVMYVTGNVQPEGLRIAEKDVPSGEDGVPNPYDGSGQPYNPYLEKVLQAWNYRKERVFAIGGVRCGIEVCLDHGAGETHRVLKTVLSNWQRQNNEPAPDVKLHLLTAGGMHIQPASVAAVPGGFILRNDGHANDDTHSELQQVIDYEKGLESTDPWDLNGKARLSPIQPLEKLPLGNNELVPMFGDGYREFTQQLAFYPRGRLP